MPTLKLNIDGKTTNLEYSDKMAKGIYVVSDSKLVLENCRTFKIEFKQEMEQRITRIQNFVMLSMRFPDSYLQCIIFNSADEDTVGDYIAGMPSPLKEQVEMAYRLLNMNFKLG